jgi:hypothetical protein
MIVATVGFDCLPDSTWTTTDAWATSAGWAGTSSSSTAGRSPGRRKEVREDWLRRVLEAQEGPREEGPAEFQGLNLISMGELHEIRRIWLNEKHEFDDRLPEIYQEVTGEEFPARE